MLKKTIYKILPPEEWKIAVVILIGIIAGLGFYIVRIANATSYLSDEPEACINCHVMNTQYASWQHSSHRRVTNCNDCHVPHNNVFNKYFFKAKDGLRHATMFTLRLEPQVIMIKEAGKGAVHDNCIRCHGKLLEVPHLEALPASGYYAIRTGRDCTACHRSTPHGRVNSLSSAPFARIPKLEDPVPKWLRYLLETQGKTKLKDNGNE